MDLKRQICKGDTNKQTDRQASNVLEGRDDQPRNSSVFKTLRTKMKTGKILYVWTFIFEGILKRKWVRKFLWVAIPVLENCPSLCVSRLLHLIFERVKPSQKMLKTLSSVLSFFLSFLSFSFLFFTFHLSFFHIRFYTTKWSVKL